MSRKQEKNILEKLEKKFYEKGAEEALKKEYPYTFCFVSNGVEYQIEVDLLENEEDYVQLGVSVSGDSFLSDFFPVSTSVVIEKKKQH